jgi:uncharacterized protein YjdB
MRVRLSALAMRLSVVGGALATAILSCTGPTDALAPRVATVTVSPSSMRLTVGSTATLQATAEDATGRVLSDRRLFWTSSDTTIARVSSGGVVSALRPGTARIAASAEGESGVAEVVVLVPVDRVEIHPAWAIIGRHRTKQFSATTYDRDGNELTGRTVTWATSDSTVATVDSTGLVTGVSDGDAVITAMAEGKSATGRVLVSKLVIGLRKARR